MRTKEAVLNILEENCDIYISGQEIADKIFVTRASVWKAIKTLQKDGYNIDAVTNRGYRLIIQPDKLDIARIRHFINESGNEIAAIYLDEVTSTNDYALTYARNHNENALIIAGRQTQGRGRRGRSFYSPEKTGLYMSLLLHPKNKGEIDTALTAMAAVATASAIDEIVYAGESHTSIKWVNDIYLDDKKVAGILAEAYSSMEDKDAAFVIIGIGINVYSPENDFPKDIRDIAGAIVKKRSDINVDILNRLAADIVIKLMNMYYQASYEKDKILEAYREKSFLTGQYIKINSFDGDNKYAFVIGIDEDYHLIVKYDDESCEHISSGEVSVVKY